MLCHPPVTPNSHEVSFPEMVVCMYRLIHSLNKFLFCAPYKSYPELGSSVAVFLLWEGVSKGPLGVSSGGRVQQLQKQAAQSLYLLSSVSGEFPLGKGLEPRGHSLSAQARKSSRRESHQKFSGRTGLQQSLPGSSVKKRSRAISFGIMRKF